MSEFSPISYKFIAAAALTASKAAVYRMKSQRAGGASLAGKVDRRDTAAASSIAVFQPMPNKQDGSVPAPAPDDALGRFYRTDLSLGRSEKADELLFTDAVCSVSASRNIVKTALVGLKGTVKEYIAAGDYEISITVGLVAVEDGKVVDKYPAEGVRKLREVLDHPEALSVDSEFLRLFEINRLVIVDYKIDQMTYSNRQVVTIKAISDEDYIIRYNEY